MSILVLQRRNRTKPLVMNSTYRYLVLLAMTLLVFNKTAAQKANFETNNGISIGFGLGTAYQQSDIANSKGGGFDFTLGSYLYKKENAFLSADWKFRFLAGENMAYDHRINADGTFSNIRYRFFNYDLELGLTLNRLRERTRIVITGFAGAGITHGITSTDLLDESGNPYDYSGIEPDLGRQQVYMDLVNLTDGNFETKLIGKGAVMPTAGIYLGYQFSRSFSLGLEHKINFSLTENNSFSGIDIDNNIVSGSRKDRNHYTSLSFRWIIRGGSSGSVPGKNYTVINTPVPVYDPPVPERPVNNPAPVITVPPPLVEIIVPSGNTYSTTEGRLEITARVNNVKDKRDIQVVLNNRNTEFDYNPLYGNVRSPITLAEGKNTLIISGSNEAGSSRDDVTIIYNKPVTVVVPMVKFIDPASPVTVNTNILSITVQTKNVKEWQDVTVNVNGINFSNFNFSTEGIVSTNIPLEEGINRVEVTGKNQSRSVSDFATITYIKPVKAIPAAISIPNPGTSPIETIDPPQETKPCPRGIRINPGNSSGEFCMVTPAGTIVRDALTNSNFRYSGPASSLYFMPIAGGSDAVVKGTPYTIRPGQYYLFTGNLTVTISTNNPGSMGQWSVCIIGDKEPLSGNGNNRPKSPCEEQVDKGKPVKPLRR